MELPERAVILLERGIVRAARSPRPGASDVNVSTSSGASVRARAHTALVGPIRPGRVVTIASDPARRGSADLGALVVGAGDLSSLPDPAVLAGVPLVVTADTGLAATAAGAARFAGTQEICELAVGGPSSDIWLALLTRASDGVPEAVVIAAGSAASDPSPSIGDVLEGAGLLGTRPVGTLTLIDTEAGPRVAPGTLEALRDRCDLEVNVAVPGLDDPAERSRLWDDLRREGLEERHQLVEVDIRTPGDSARAVHDLGSRAAGILAGRMAVGARSWRRGP